MSNMLHTDTVLSLDSLYRRANWRTPAEAIAAMMGGKHGNNPPALALNMVYKTDENDMPIYDQLEYWAPVTFEEWIKLPIRPGDKAIHTVKSSIRVPTIIVCPHFSKTVHKRRKATPSSIRERDGNRCQYTGVLLTNKTFSLDHVKPKSKGGRDNWENLVASHRDVNSKKGNSFNHEVGLKLLKQPLAPKDTPLSATIKGNRHPDHAYFG